MTTSLRIFAIGGLMSYRALFYWLTFWIFVPGLIVAPVFQILLFVSRSSTPRSRPCSQ